MLPDSFELTLTLLLGVRAREPAVPLWVMEWTARGLLAAWLFAFGASIGSFLNVVVYRLPRGMDLVYPGSHCPRCGHAIRLWDNIPIISWLLLGGRCRDCRGPISSRYFWVELAVASTFLAVAIVEAFLPRGFQEADPQLRPLLTTYHGLPFWCAYATHVILITTLIGAALIDFDGWPTPARMFFPVSIMAVVLPMIWPQIRRAPMGLRLGNPDTWQAALVEGLVGMSAGAMLGITTSLAWRIAAKGRLQPGSLPGGEEVAGEGPKFAPICLFAAAGAVLGWQRVLVPAAGSLVALAIAIAVFRSMRRPFPVALPLIALVVPFLVEAPLEWLDPMRLSRTAFIAVLLVSVAVLAVSAALAGFLAPSIYFTLPPVEVSHLEPLPEMLPGEPASAPDNLQEPAAEIPEPPSSP